MLNSWMIKSRNMRLAGYVARVGEELNACRVVTRKNKKNYEDLSVDGKIILKWVLKNRVEGCRLD